MAEFSAARVWTMRLAFLLLALLILSSHLIPLDTQPRRWAPPDLLTAFTFAWLLRRPDYVPALLIASVVLLADFLLMRPPGLMAFLMVLGTEYARRRATGLTEASFVGEWVAVGLILTAIMVLNRFALLLFAVVQAPLGLTVVQLIATILCYPLVALITQSLMRVHKPAPGDGEMAGARS